MRKEHSIYMGSMIMYILAVICIVYFVVLAFYTGLASKYHFIWLAGGIFLLAFGKLVGMNHAGVIQIPKAVTVIFVGICIAAAIVFVWVEAIIIANGHAKPQQDAAYMIVLGGQVKGTRVSLLLKYRLDAAYDYLVENEDTVVIVSGGQGTGEDISEAQAMQEYLVAKGIDAERICMEDKSVNTDQNIAFSRAFMDSNADSVVVVSNAFHIYRAVGICKKQGLTQVEGLGAKSSLLTVPTNYLREAMAVVKYKLCGQI